MGYTGIAYSVKRLAERGLWQSLGIEMLAHHNAVQAEVPHPRGAVAAAFQFQINLLPLITPF